MLLLSTTRKGFWFAHTCACSLYLFKKTLLIFPKSKQGSHKDKVQQVQAPDQ